LHNYGAKIIRNFNLRALSFCEALQKFRKFVKFAKFKDVTGLPFLFLGLWELLLLLLEGGCLLHANTPYTAVILLPGGIFT
jgi:hypothetical protein